MSGKIILDGEPVTGKTGILLLQPDASKGNTSPFLPRGTIDKEGKFTLTTRGKAGAPPGWYKVVVSVSEPGYGDVDDQALIRPDYQSDKTPLRIEVVRQPQPDAYDLQLQTN